MTQDIGVLRANDESSGFLKRLEAVDEDVVGVLLFTLVIVVVLQIASRLFLHRPFVWTLELAQSLFIWLICFGGVIGVRRKSLQAIDILVRIFPATVRWVMAFGFHLVMIGFTALLVWQGGVLTASSLHQTMPTTGLPRAAVFIAVPICGILMLFYLCRQALGIAKKGV